MSLRSLNNYFFRGFPYKSLLNRFSVLISYIMWFFNPFSTFSCFPHFTRSRFFRVKVFQGPGFSGSRFFWVQVFQGPGFSGSRLFRIQVFQGPGLSGSRFFRVRVQGLDPDFRSSHIKHIPNVLTKLLAVIKKTHFETELENLKMLRLSYTLIKMLFQ